MSTHETPNILIACNHINEPTKRGAPTNKNISVRNMKAQIVNMSVNDNDGFKNEYNVRNVFLLYSNDRVYLFVGYIEKMMYLRFQYSINHKFDQGVIKLLHQATDPKMAYLH